MWDLGLQKPQSAVSRDSWDVLLGSRKNGEKNMDTEWHLCDVSESSKDSAVKWTHTLENIQVVGPQFYIYVHIFCHEPCHIGCHMLGTTFFA